MRRSTDEVVDHDVHDRETVRPQPCESTLPTLVVPAADAVSRLRDVLAAERDAARRADSSALVAIQEMKREAIDAVREANPPQEVWDSLSQQAQANIELMRHLVGCLRGIVGISNTYGSTAQVQIEDAGRDHGAA